ncbi:MAG: hypothetical protein OXB86_06205 [Bdellovibrionales bacterium]|nr:hypothetical protein [Bdellovibrionales bacterium]
MKSFRPGIAMVEILPLLVVFITFFGLTMGLWGAVHSGTLQSIAARHYAFEVINNRTHVEHHRDWDPAVNAGTEQMFQSPTPSLEIYHGLKGMRLFAVVIKQSGKPEGFVENRGLNFFNDIDRSHNDSPGGILSSPETDAANKYSSRSGFLEDTQLFIQTPPINPIWLMNGYGICLNCCCGNKAADWPCTKDDCS